MRHLRSAFRTGQEGGKAISRQRLFLRYVKRNPLGLVHDFFEGEGGLLQTKVQFLRIKRRVNFFVLNWSTNSSQMSWGLPLRLVVVSPLLPRHINNLLQMFVTEWYSVENYPASTMCPLQNRREASGKFGQWLRNSTFSSLAHRRATNTRVAFSVLCTQCVSSALFVRLMWQYCVHTHVWHADHTPRWGDALQFGREREGRARLKAKNYFCGIALIYLCNKLHFPFKLNYLGLTKEHKRFLASRPCECLG